MSSSINRHKSTRWVQTQQASYGDEWGDISGSGSENGSVNGDEAEAEAEEEAQDTTVDGPATQLAQQLDSDLQLDTEPASGKRNSRFFVTNPDPSDTESEKALDTAAVETEGIETGQDAAQSPEVGAAASEDEPPAEQEEDASSFNDIEPTAPLKVRSRMSSRNASVNLDEEGEDKLADEKREKLKSKDYSNINMVMDDYLSKRDSQFYQDGEAAARTGDDLQQVDEADEAADVDVDVDADPEAEADEPRGRSAYLYDDGYDYDADADDQMDAVDHDHSLRHSQQSDSTHNGLSTTPFDYSLARSLSSGSLSTGSWSARSSAAFVNGTPSARDSFLSKAANDRRASVAADSLAGRAADKSDSSSEETNEKDTYMGSSSEDEESLSKLEPGQSINFGHWRPSASTYRKAFIADVDPDAQSIAPSVNEEDEYDDGASVMTDQSSILYPTEEGHFFTKSLDAAADSSRLESHGDSSDTAESTFSGGQTRTLDPENESQMDAAFGADDEDDSNATETEQGLGEADEDTDIDEPSTDSYNDTSIDQSITPQSTSKQQRYSSLLSDSTAEGATPRQTSLSSFPETRNVSGTTPRVVSFDSNASSQQTVLRSKMVANKPFTPFNFKPIQQLTNPENRITELRKLRKDEMAVDTGLQDWLAVELAKNMSAPDSYDTLGPITLSAYKQATTTTHLHGHSVADMITRKHSINFGGVVGHGRLRKVGDHGGNLAKGIFNRGKKIMKNNGTA